MKSRCIIIAFLLLAAFNESYGSGLSSKPDTGKHLTETFVYSGIFRINKTKPVKLGADLLQKQSALGFITNNLNTNPAGARMLRTGLSTGVFDVEPDDYKQLLILPFPTGYVELTDYDRKNFVLTASLDSVNQWKDTVYYYGNKMRNCLRAVTVVKLTNQSSDTLKYFNMSCAWLDIFTIDGGDVKIIPNNIFCYKNGPVVCTVPPHQTVTFHIPVTFLDSAGRKQLFVSKTFKIGMGLYKYTGGNNRILNLNIASRYSGPGNVIWANEITVR